MWPVLFMVLLSVVLVVVFNRWPAASGRRLRAYAKERGCVYKGHFPGFEISGVVEGVEVQATLRSLDSDQNVGYRLDISVQGARPDLDEGLARLLVGPDCTEWQLVNGAWIFQAVANDDESVKLMSSAETVIRRIDEGLAFARCLANVNDLSEELRAALTTPARFAELRGTPAWEEARALARTDPSGALGRRLALASHEPGFLAEAALELTPSGSDAFDALVALASTSPEATHALALRMTRRHELSAHATERLAIALRKCPHPEAEAVLQELLAHRAPEVVLSALESLRAIGTSDSLAALRAAHAAAGLGSVRRRVAEQAVAAVEARAASPTTAATSPG